MTRKKFGKPSLIAGSLATLACSAMGGCSIGADSAAPTVTSETPRTLAPDAGTDARASTSEAPETFVDPNVSLHPTDALTSALPAPYSQIVSLTESVATAFGGSGASTAISVANGLLQAAGWLKQPESSTDQALATVESDLGTLYSATLSGFNMTRADFLAQYTGEAATAQSEAAQTVTGQISNDFQDALNKSLDAYMQLEQSALWFRVYDANVFKQTYFSDVVETARPSGSDLSNGLSWDYRGVLPAMLDVVQKRLAVLAMYDPQYVFNGHFGPGVLHDLKMFLKGQHDHMLQGVKCGYGYKFMNDDGNGWDPPSGTTAIWRYQAGCLDIYSGAVTLGPGSIDYWDHDEPDTNGAWAARAAPNDIYFARQALLNAEGIPALEQIIATLGWYENKAHRVYYDTQILQLAKLNGGEYPQVAAATGNANLAELWTYDPDLSLLRNNVDGSCLFNDTANNGAYTLAACDWYNNSGYAWQFQEPVGNPHLVGTKNGKCFDTVADISGVGSVMQPCDNRQSENISWHKLTSGSGPASDRDRDHLHVVSTNTAGAWESAEWSGPYRSISPWVPDGFLAGETLPASAPITAVGRLPNRLDVVAVDGTKSMVANGRYDDASGGTLDGWHAISSPSSLPIPAGSPAALVARTASSLDAFAIDNAGAVVHAAWTQASGWAAAQEITAQGVAPAGGFVTAVSRNPNVVDALFIGNSGGMLDVTIDVSGEPSFSSTTYILPSNTFLAGGACASISRDDDIIDVFAVGKDGSVWTNELTVGTLNQGIPQGPTWGTASQIAPMLSGASGKSIAANSMRNARVDVFWIGPTGSIHSNFKDWNNTSTGGWSQHSSVDVMPAGEVNLLTSDSTTRIGALARYSGQQDIFTIHPTGKGNSVWYSEYLISTGNWSTEFALLLN